MPVRRARPQRWRRCSVLMALLAITCLPFLILAPGTARADAAYDALCAAQTLDEFASFRAFIGTISSEADALSQQNFGVQLERCAELLFRQKTRLPTNLAMLGLWEMERVCRRRSGPPRVCSVIRNWAWEANLCGDPVGDSLSSGSAPSPGRPSTPSQNIEESDLN
jgi:hypothetical protein